VGPLFMRFHTWKDSLWGWHRFAGCSAWEQLALEANWMFFAEINDSCILAMVPRP
jgi:hypothetical protein